MRSPSSPLLGPFALAMINVAAIASLRDLPQMAKYGTGCIFFYLLAGLAFFFPVSLVAAELATGWPERGGVYVWVRGAFGRQHGFAAVFIQWFQNLCWYLRRLQQRHEVGRSALKAWGSMGGNRRFPGSGWAGFFVDGCQNWLKMISPQQH